MLSWLEHCAGLCGTGAGTAGEPGEPGAWKPWAVEQNTFGHEAKCLAGPYTGGPARPASSPLGSCARTARADGLRLVALARLLRHERKNCARARAGRGLRARSPRGLSAGHGAALSRLPVRERASKGPDARALCAGSPVPVVRSRFCAQRAALADRFRVLWASDRPLRRRLSPLGSGGPRRGLSLSLSLSLYLPLSPSVGV